jgi:hypothetical protein
MNDCYETDTIPLFLLKPGGTTVPGTPELATVEYRCGLLEYLTVTSEKAQIRTWTDGVVEVTNPSLGIARLEPGAPH